MNLSTSARGVLAQLFVNTAKSFGIDPVAMAIGQNYAATPSTSQTIYNKIVEDGNPFLQLINILPVSEMTGEKVGMSLTGNVASRTDTSASGERVPKHLNQLDAKAYALAATEFDVALKYALIDAWAKFPDFAARYMQLVRQAIGNDMLTIGWLGTSVAADSVAADLSDVNKGWLQIIRDFNAGSQHVLGSVGSVTLGSATFKNLDVLAKEARDLLPIYHQQRDDLVLLVGSNVMSYQEDTYFELNGNTPTEKAMLSGRITKAYAGMPTMVPPFFPADSILVTPLKNLSIYYQDSSIRRIQKDKPEKNEVQDFNSANQGYVVEDEQLTGFVEGIEYA